MLRCGCFFPSWTATGPGWIERVSRPVSLARPLLVLCEAHRFVLHRSEHRIVSYGEAETGGNQKLADFNHFDDQSRRPARPNCAAQIDGVRRWPSSLYAIPARRSLIGMRSDPTAEFVVVLTKPEVARLV